MRPRTRSSRSRKCSNAKSNTSCPNLPRIKQEYQQAEQDAKLKKMKEREIMTQLKDKEKEEYIMQLRQAEEDEQEKQRIRRTIAINNQEEVATVH